MRHGNELLSKMSLSVDGAIARASDIYVDDGGNQNKSWFQRSHKESRAHTRKNIHPADPSLCVLEGWGMQRFWQGEDISRWCVCQAEEMQSQKIIRFSELPLVGKIRGMYKSIGTKPQAMLAGDGRPASDGSKRKSRVNFDELDVSKDLLKWS